MPQITNDKDHTLQKDLVNKVQAKIRHILNIEDQKEKFNQISQLPELINSIDSNLIDDPRQLIQDHLYQLALMVGKNKDENKNKIVQTLITSIFKKIVEIFVNRTKDTSSSLEFINKLFKKQSVNIFHKMKAYFYWSDKKEYNELYYQCVSSIIKELSLHPKIVWQIDLKQTAKLINFVNVIQPNPLHNKDAADYIQTIASQLHAFFKSGRPELAKLAKSKDIVGLKEALCKKKQDSSSSSSKMIASFGLTLSESLIRSDNLQQNKAGLNLLEAQINQKSHFERNLLKQDDLIEWANKSQIYQYLLSHPELRNQIVEFSSVSKFFKTCKKENERIKMLLDLLRNNPNNEKLSKFVYPHLDGYFLEEKSKLLIYEYFQNLEDYTSVPIVFFETVKELVNNRSQSYQLSQKIFNFAIKIIKQAYQKWNSNYQSRCFRQFKRIFSHYISLCKYKGSETKQKILKDYVTAFLSEVSLANIALFNQIVKEQQMWHFMSNTTFQDFLTNTLESLKYFDKLFQEIDRVVVNKSAEKQFIKLIKFLSSKSNSKNDSTFKYIQILSRYPQVFEELLFNASYSQLEEQMKKVIQLFKQQPQTPFHIFTLTFQKVNHQHFSNYLDHVGLLNQKIQKKLTDPPKRLKFYEAALQLMLQTKDHKLRSLLCNYIYSLYFNFKNQKSYYSESGQQQFLTFITEVLQNFANDYGQFLDNPSNKSHIYVSLELIQKSLQFTDILGCGQYKPHKSLVSTSTIFLKIVNNVTFGDDVDKHLHRDFPSSMTLFDALTIIGLSFKCGPEDIVLKQNERLISPIFNSFSLEDLELTNEQIIAQPNKTNVLQPPELHQSKSKELSPQVIKVITDIFNQFAFEGKMSILQCTNFVRRESGSDCLSSDRRVKDIFEFDSDNDGIIVLSDFIDYYKKNITGYSSSYYKQKVLKGFDNLRYRKNLTLYSDPLDISQQYYLMSRFKISKNYSNIYEILFQLSSHEDQYLSHKSRQLLLLLPSHLQIKNQILQQINFSSSSEFEIYYKLIFIENELNTQDASQTLAESKKRKIQLFVNNKNNQTIFMLLGKYHSKAVKIQYEQKSLLICLRILRSLINIEYLAHANLSQTKFDQIFIPLLPANTYFAQQTTLAFNSRNLLSFQTLLVLQLTQQNVDLHSIIKYCFSEEKQVRKISCNFVYLWSIKSKFAFDLFSVNISEERNEEWFQLLCRIIQQGNSNLKVLKDRSLSIILSRQQNFHKSYDHLMNGYLKILLAISQKEDLNMQDGEQVLTRLLNNTLQPRNRSLIFDLIKKINRQVGYNYFDDMLSRIRPSQECQIRKRFLGIKNLGAICYMNSILQQFFMIDKFKHMILSRNIPQNCKQVQANGKIVVDDFFYQLQKLYHYLQYSQKKYIIPRDFCFSIKDFDGKPINTSIQQDAHQFLNRLVENAQEAFKKENKLEQFADILTLKKLTELQCQKCGNRIDKIENDYCLTIEVKGHDSVIDSLKKFTEKQEISDYFCQKCNKKVNKINKKTFLNQLPEIVILNLQRIIYDQQKGDKVKVHSQLTFPMTLNFQQFIKNDNKNIQTQYTLKGVVIHTGTSQGGHYYSLIKTKKYGWLKFNDQNVTQFDEKDIERQSFGGFESKDGWGETTYSTNAYILFYQKAQLPQKEFIEIENQFTSQIQLQNKSLISEYQIHQQSFFNAIISYYEAIRYPDLQQITKKQPFLQETIDKSLKKQYQTMLNIIKKAFGFLTICTSIPPATRNKIGCIFSQLFYILPQETVSFLKETNINTYIQNVISNSTMNERQILKEVICSVIIIHCRYYGLDGSMNIQEPSLIHEILRTIHSYMQNLHFYNNIGKVSSYLSLMNTLMKNLKFVAIYLSQNDYYFQLLDLLMGKESSYMKYHHFAQDLHANCLTIVYESICFLLNFKINFKGTKLSQSAIFKTTTLQGSILTNPSFYRRIVRKKYDHPLLVPLVHHYSINDFDFSAIVAQFLITNLNNQEQFGDLKILFQLTKMFLSIKDDFCFARYSWILGIPQYKEISQYQYCLQYSYKTDYLRYISGVNYKKPAFSDPKKPLLQIANDRLRTNTTSIYSVQVIVALAVQSQTAFQYLINIPPSSYLYKSYFDWMRDYIERISKDSDIIIDNKSHFLTCINNMLQIILERVKINTSLPVQKLIIGKTKSYETIKSHKQFKLQKIITYVLQNKPTGQENQSMPSKNFSSDPYGIGHGFISQRSKIKFQNQVKEVKTCPTILRIKGETKQKLLLTFKGNFRRHWIILNEGQFLINIPYEKQVQNQEFFDVKLCLDYKIEAIPQEIAKAFKIQEKKEGMMDEQKGSHPANPSADPKIKCSACTFDNELSSERCEMCDTMLYL